MITSNKPTKPPTLMMYYPDLTAQDRALILRAYNIHRAAVINGQAEPIAIGPEAHFGLLPFISMTRIAAALAWMGANATEYRHIWAKVCSKVEASRWLTPDMPKHDSWSLVLVNALVHKYFGARPELGVHLPTIPNERTRGPLKWNIGAKEWQPEKILAAPRITLLKIQNYRNGRGEWVLHAPTRYKQLAINWLLDHCS